MTDAVVARSAVPGAFVGTLHGTIVWFRQDLRLHDNPALHAAVERGGWIIPLYVQCDAEEEDWQAGAASRWWLQQSLLQLDAALRARASRLIFRQGPAQQILKSLTDDSGADAVYWNRRYEPAAIARDSRIKETLRGAGVACSSFNSALLMEPWDLSSPTGQQYKVFTPFKKRLLDVLDLPAPHPTPDTVTPPAIWPASAALDDLTLMPKIVWYRQMAHHWQPGESGGLARSQRFLRDAVGDYPRARDFPYVAGTSSLSPHLHFGEVSVRQLVHGIAADRNWRDSIFVSELLWREFSYHMLFHFPATPREPLDRKFERFEWKPDQSLLEAWQRGLTGFPIVDAGMRQLWALGWMHNRVRMIVASLLVKNMQQPWISGAQWFWDTLVDADLAANTLNWQWVAGCGADAAPYFRVFNPVLQGGKFDPNGDYVRHWVPELRGLSAEHIHAPHLAPQSALAAAAVRIGDSYPAPVIDLKQSREQALLAYRAMRAG